MKENNNNIIDISTFRKNPYLDKMVEYPEYYEYETIQSYEEWFDDLDIHTIPLGGVSVNINKLKKQKVLTSILFNKEKFSIEAALEWLDIYNVALSDEVEVENASEVIDFVRFEGKNLICYKKGRHILTIDEEKAIEVTKEYETYQKYVDSKQSKRVNRSDQMIIYWCEEKEQHKMLLEDFQRLEFDENDVILCNGLKVDVDYIDLYDIKTLGFYKYTKDQAIAIIEDINTDIYINIHKDINGRSIYDIKFNYIIDMEGVTPIDSNIEKKSLRIVMVEENLVSTTWRVYLTESDDGPFYKVRQDMETESIVYYSGKGARPQYVMEPLSLFPYESKTISEVILKDMETKGLKGFIIENTPWE
ncbi:MAG: hypothetical protein ACLFMO_07380 [Eubacteriales bacterium]